MMVHHPEVVDRAHVELDEFIESNQRLPSFEDRDQLPFVDCILKEVYRYVVKVFNFLTRCLCTIQYHFSIHPPAPFGEYPIYNSRKLSSSFDIGIPHRSVEEDVYEGWTIPAGSLIMTNLWSVIFPFHAKMHASLKLPG